MPGMLHVSGSPNTYLYLEVGGSLLCFCYAANALVRFRGTHDRVALILAFGFVLSGMIETLGYFGLTNLSARRPCRPFARAHGLDGRAHAARGTAPRRPGGRTIPAHGAATQP